MPSAGATESTSSTLPETLTVSGTVEQQNNTKNKTFGSSDGKYEPIEKGIVLLRWNNWQDPENQDAGRSNAELVTLDATTIGSNGTYHFEVPLTANLERAAKTRGGALNLSLHTLTSKDEFSITSFSTRWDGTNWSKADNPGSSEIRAVVAKDADGELTNGTVLDEDTASEFRAATLQPGDPPRNCPVGSAVIFQDDTSVLEVHNLDSSTMKWVYKQASNSTVEAALQLPGQAWQVNGSYSVSESASAEGEGTLDSHTDGHVKATFSYTKWEYLNVPQDPTCIEVEQIAVNTWTGGLDVVEDTVQRACGESHPYHAHVGENITLKLYETKAQKISGAAEVLGVSLGATSGYSSTAGMEWTAGPDGLNLCGLNAPPASKNAPPGVVWAGYPDCPPGEICENRGQGKRG